MIKKLLSKPNSLRGVADTLGVSRLTVVRKARFLGLHAEFRFRRRNFSLPKATVVEFDDMETFEHSKYKPLSITLAVESGTRRILGIEVSVMPSKSALAKKALEKYGPRRDERRLGRQTLFAKIKPFIVEGALIKSDANPHYGRDVKDFFPSSPHLIFKGRKARDQGQGELKQGGFDPLFSLNHTCAMLRANVNRLIRKTWCTTKSIERLYGHLMLYADVHNEKIALRNP